jgi:hypothetical protein
VTANVIHAKSLMGCKLVFSVPRFNPHEIRPLCRSQSTGGGPQTLRSAELTNFLSVEVPWRLNSHLQSAVVLRH